MSVRSLALALLLLGVALAPGRAADTSTRPVEGLRQNTPQVHALVNARIIVAPGRSIDRGTIVVRDGVIEQVGDVQVPGDARVWDLEGKTIYPGLIDAYGEVTVEAAPAGEGSPYWNALVTPELSLAERYKPDAALDKKLRSQGITARLVAPARGIWKGTSCVVTTGEEPPRDAIVRAGVAQHLRLTVPRGRGRDNYPNSPMGAVALARQALYDADWYRKAWAAHRADTTLPRPERNDALDALQGYLEGNLLVMADAPNELFALRADLYAREFALNLVLRGSGHEYKRLPAIQETGRAVIVPVNFPKPPNVATAETALNVPLDDLMHWDIAPENPARLEQAGVRIALTSDGLPDVAGFLAAVRKAVARGLSPEAALRALTTTPAALLGVERQLGTIETGKIANLCVTDGDLFESKTKVLQTWVNGRRYEVVPDMPFDVRGEWEIKPEGERPPLLMKLSGTPARLEGVVRLAQSEGEPKEKKLSRIGFRDGRLSCTFDAQDLWGPGVARLTAVVAFGEQAAPNATGHVTLADGERIGFVASRVKEFTPDDKAKTESAQQQNPDQPQGESDEKKPAEADGEKTDARREAQRASFAVNYPLGAFGVSRAPEQPRYVLFRNATVWTCGEAGVLENASVLVEQGRIRQVAREIAPPADAIIIDATGKHITPGIIDCHSHMATDGGINESTQAITAEVRIGDFVDPDDISIYRQLAGGVTAANVLHGSANPIGGQNQVVKLRWGALPEELKFAEAPPGIKFALGENVKQSNWGENYTTRYPQTRMGVEQIIHDAFQAAKDYRRRAEAWKQTRQGLPPRVDLELEALAEIVEGKRWIHCHSYRQDEILALLRTLEELGIQIGSLQHILEGYKVADAMAKHGATGSAFSDWWAYKFEVYDAIPYAGALMHNAGVIVSFNSDDQELARHLNHEAAKAVKYGGVPEIEALKFVTLNPARQLRIDPYVGSLERGKHADLVVWSGHPLSILSRCEQTWIDGRKYFDLESDRAARAEADRMRNELTQKILASGQEMKKEDEASADESDLWPREDIFCHRHRHTEHTHGHEEH